MSAGFAGGMSQPDGETRPRVLGDHTCQQIERTGQILRPLDQLLDRRQPVGGERARTAGSFESIGIWHG